MASKTSGCGYSTGGEQTKGAYDQANCETQEKQEDTLLGVFRAGFKVHKRLFYVLFCDPKTSGVSLRFAAFISVGFCCKTLRQIPRFASYA